MASLFYLVGCLLPALLQCHAKADQLHLMAIQLQ